ncbi:MAG: putative lipid II flippase FtsW [Gammaproteobacteria bacterium]|nr:MAG: putative lipid II flippase FtsW [Gammaproteobacteria bacterium]
MSQHLQVRGFNLDGPSLAAIIALMVLGAVMVSSASISLADQEIGEPLFFLLRQLGALLIGCLVALAAMLIPTEVWFRLNWLLLLGSMALLISVLLPGLGHTVNGSTRWLDFGLLTLQPSEPARMCLILYLASYVVRHQRELGASFLGFLKPMLIVTLACALLLAEPDFGAAVVLTVTSMGLLFIGGARLRDFVLSFFVALVALSVLALSSSYRMQRLTTFLDPWADPYASGFQLTQSLIAVGRGNWFGVGLGESVQKLFYLPEAHTDFVFAVLAEELGFVGVTLAVFLFGVIVLRAVALGPKAAALGMPFHGLVSTGIALTLGLQAFINMGVNTGLLPTKGLTLPLISYGRTSAVITLLSLGLLIRIHHEVQLAVRQAETRPHRKQQR